MVSAGVIALGIVCARDAEKVCKGTSEAAERVTGLSLKAEEDCGEQAREMEKKVWRFTSPDGSVAIRSCFPLSSGTYSALFDELICSIPWNPFVISNATTTAHNLCFVMGWFTFLFGASTRESVVSNPIFSCFR